jgi:hypothetical protein
MQKVAALAVFALIGTGIAAAGQIQIGGGSNGANGLTSTYVGSQTGWLAKNYDTRLFQGATEAGNLVSPTYTSGAYAYSTPYQTASATLKDASADSGAGVTFAMIADGTSSGNPAASNNFWEGYQAQTLTIPVGVFDVTDVWTLMNNIWGTPNAVDTTVTFDFGASATGAATEVLTVQLTNAGSNATGTPSGQISTSVECTTVAATCNSYAIGPTAASSSIATSGSGSSLLSNITVLTDRVLSMAYNGAAASTPFVGSSGNVVLGDQGFEFGSAFSNLYLVNVKIAEASGAGNVSQTALSAITVDSVVAPEPSTMWLILSGFGAMGFSYLRKKK